ncbi:hypothetical protein MNEG_15611, partial [Monoraphidium neglectum]
AASPPGARAAADAQAAEREAGLSRVGDGSVGDWLGVDLRSPNHGASGQRQQQQQQQHG